MAECKSILEAVAVVFFKVVKFFILVEYWNHFRPHAGLGGAMGKPYEQDMDSEITGMSFLGGLLHGYRRERCAA